MEQVWQQRLGESAHNPIRQFQIVYCAWLAIAMLCSMRSYCPSTAEPRLSQDRARISDRFQICKVGAVLAF